MQPNGTMQGGAVHGTPLLTRFAAKLVIDVLPAAIASLIGGFMITQYQFSHIAPPRPAAEQAAPASAEMMQLVRDEHAMIIDYLKTEMAAEKSRYAADDQADAHAAAAAQVAAAPPEDPAAELRRLATSLAASKPKARIKVAAAAAPTLPPHEPLVLAQAEQVAVAPSVANAAPAPAPEQTSLLAKTLDIKDHVVHATLHVVSAIGSIPSWVASMGDRIGGANTSSNPGTQQFASSS
ncbi:MAG TPA: hypothetical protein VMR17_22135 [Xanthobacteraceae bacterium]|nr:hypothetical protein [Xanthobacteraceae bacterium]